MAGGWRRPHQHVSRRYSIVTVEPAWWEEGGEEEVAGDDERPSPSGVVRRESQCWRGGSLVNDAVVVNMREEGGRHQRRRE